MAVSWQLSGPRRCTGVWNGHHRDRCPLNATVTATGTDSQCRVCAGRDPGRRIARDYTGDDGRAWKLYLAWFGPDLFKVGVTAAERGRDRLLEQGALAFTDLAAGSYPAVRRAEQLIARAHLARERLSGRSKAQAWWSLPDPGQRHAQLEAARTATTAVLGEHAAGLGALELLDGPIVDQVTEFGLDCPPPGLYQLVVSLTDPAHLSGTVRAIVGRQLFIDTPTDTGEQTVLLDTRLLGGWTIRTTQPGPPSGLTFTPRTRPKDHDDQNALS